jgi:F-type H+-transporting ATPase subunit b
MLLSLDGTLVVQLVNFLIFLVILNAIFLRPVGQKIVERRAYIDGLYADIETYQAQVTELQAQAAATVADARRAAEAGIARARVSAQSEVADILADHQVQASAIVAEAQATVGLEVAQARLGEAAVVDAIAHTMLERAVGPELAA